MGDDTVVVEGNHYFPREGVRTELLSDSPTPYTCPWKGEAAYFNLELNGERVKDVAWSYPNPKEAAKEIAGYLAFDRSKGVTVAFTDDSIDALAEGSLRDAPLISHEIGQWCSYPALETAAKHTGHLHAHLGL